MDLKGMTTEQLEAAQRGLHVQVKGIKAKKRAIAIELDQRAAIKEVEKLLGKASPAARQIIANAGGIASQEAFGEPGMKG